MGLERGHEDISVYSKDAFAQQQGIALIVFSGLGHSADPKEIDDLEAYIAARLPPLDSSKSGK